MKFDLEDYINSGILEAFVAGTLDDKATKDVQKNAANNVAVKEAIDEISISIENYFLSQDFVQPSPAVKPFLMAVIDYTERMNNGEISAEPPELHQHSTPADYAEWLTRADMHLPLTFEHFYAKIIGYTPKATTAIAWIKTMAPAEVHEDEHEKFLILEGTCDFTIGDKTIQLGPGDVFFIPLHVNHHLKVTSPVPCKVILQRVAA